MSPIEKAIRFVLRMLSAGLILTSLLLFSANVFYLVGGKKMDDSFSSKASKSIPLIVGIALWAKSGPWAERLTELFED